MPRTARLRTDTVWPQGNADDNIPTSCPFNDSRRAQSGTGVRDSSDDRGFFGRLTFAPTVSVHSDVCRFRAGKFANAVGGLSNTLQIIEIKRCTSDEKSEKVRLPPPPPFYPRL